ncbi:rhomboid family intramembrane serine protease GlpG [Psychromonas sp.]|uniref:rhomboid family intramembrane serine protease GlpG n=1 Tax=Psychromonas sp. TaxID=1884585 RepID=UPI003565DB17
MFLLHQFQNRRAAQAFSDYLNSIGIRNKLEHGDFDYALFIAQEEQQAQAQVELDLFLQHPNNPKYLSASWQAGEVSADNNHFAFAASNLAGNFISHAGIITHSVFALCLVIYLLIVSGLFQPIPSVLAFFTHLPFDYTQSWRFITPAFLHFSALHIIFNLLWWWELAGMVEKQQGKVRLLLLFVFSGVAANLAQYFLVSPYFGGLSGVVYGLVGYCWLFGKLNKNSKVQLPNSYFIFLLAWLAFGFVDLLPMNVANYAHLVGLLAGLLLAFVMPKEQQ